MTQVKLGTLKKGVILQNSNAVKVGAFEVPVTPSLRELFSRTHSKMSGSRPTEQQYPLQEQQEMYLVCEVIVKGKKDEVDKEKTEENLLELLHYLNGNGVFVPRIAGSIRCFGLRTRGVAVRLHLDEVRRRKKLESRVAPVLRFQGAPLEVVPA